MPDHSPPLSYEPTGLTTLGSDDADADAETNEPCNES
jgi:hypothetical protein